MLFTIKTLALSYIGTAAATRACTGTYKIEITNLAYAQVFSPPLFVVHDKSIALFTPGMPASDALVKVAENGDVSGFKTLLASPAVAPKVYGMVSSTGPVMPGATWTGMITISSAMCSSAILSGVGMLVNTNDAFFGLSTKLPTIWTSYLVPAYDSGSEVNNQDCQFVPGPACPGSPNKRATGSAEGFVHIHRGIHDGAGGLPEAEYDWRNPVALISVTLT